MKKLASKIKLPVDSLREATWSTIILFSILYCIYVSFVNFVVFKSNIFNSVIRLTYGIINETLIVNIFSIIIFVFIIILGYGRLSFIDLGLKKNRLLSATAAILTLWVLIQLFNIIAAIIISGKPTIYSGWNKYGASIVYGNFLSQLFGNCLFEELAFRGFLLVQMYKKLKNKKMNLFTRVVLSQLLFAFIHIPNRIMAGSNSAELLISLTALLIIGVLFAAAYLITDNLFLVVGLHALWNMPLPIFAGYTNILTLLVFILLLPVIWDRSFGRFNAEYNNSVSAKL